MQISDVMSDFKTDALGKPFLDHLPFAFSISKIPGLIVVLAAEDIESLGVDIVADQQCSLLPELDIYTDNERQRLSQQPECIHMCMRVKRPYSKQQVAVFDTSLNT